MHPETMKVYEEHLCMLADLEKLDELSRIVDDVVARIKRKPMHWNVNRSHGFSIQGVNVVFYDIDSVHDLDEIRLALRMSGLHLSGECEQEPEMKRLHWSYRRDVADPSWFRVNILAFLKWGDTKAACQFVQVGTKETPVYEIRCDGHAVDLKEV